MAAENTGQRRCFRVDKRELTVGEPVTSAAEFVEKHSDAFAIEALVTPRA